MDPVFITKSLQHRTNSSTVSKAKLFSPEWFRVWVNNSNNWCQPLRSLSIRSIVILSFLFQSDFISINLSFNLLISAVNDKNTLYLEICALLKELFCPYKCLMEGPVDQRFDSIDARLTLLGTNIFYENLISILIKLKYSKISWSPRFKQRE